MRDSDHGGLDHGLDHDAALGGRQAAGLAHRAGGDEAVDARLEQRLEILLERRHVDLVVGGERGGDGGDDPFEAGH